MTEWMKPKEDKPPQGLKVLCMHKGDFYVAQRMGEYWFSIPFADSKFSRYFEPELWQYINFPDPYHGKLLIMVSGNVITMDMLEKEQPKIYKEMVEGMLITFKNGMKQETDINKVKF